MVRNTVKAAALHLGYRLLRAYFRYIPIAAGKEYVWNRVFRRYLGWRQFPIDAKSVFGMRFRGSFPDLIHSYLYLFGVWEPALTAYLESVLKPGDIVVDVGANVGAHALLAAHLVGPGGRVHAIEASPAIFRRLRTNIDLNGLRNVTAYNLAVSDRAGFIPIYLRDANNLGATTTIHELVDAQATVEQVEARLLQDIVPIDQLRAARLIKIDVEGAEWLVANGMKPLLPELADNVLLVVEVSGISLKIFDASFAQFLEIFTKEGFTARQIRNEYEAGFYINPQPLLLSPAQDPGDGMVDLIFERGSSSAGSKGLSSNPDE